MAKGKKSNIENNVDNTVKIRDLNPPSLFLLENEFAEYAALAINMFRIDCLDPAIKFGYLEERFIKKQLVYTNFVGYDKLINKWAKCVGYGLNDYWAPDNLVFIFPNGKSYTRKALYEPNKFGAYLIQGYPDNLTLAGIIQKATDKMQACDKVIYQNLEAIKTPQYVLVKDKETRLSVLHAIQQRNAGEPVIVIDEALGDGMKGIDNLTQFIVPEVYQYRTEIKNELLNKLGTMTANINKRERVQVGEVNAMVGLCEDYVYMLIDNLERQFKEYNLPFKATINTSLEELYTEMDENTNPEGDKENV